MSLLLCMLAAVLIGIAGWGFNAVMAELAKSHPFEPLDTLSRRFEVDQFIWSSRAPRALRKQYIATQACTVPACLCLAALVWMNEPRPDVRALGTVAFCAISFFAAALLAWKALRRGE
jgi:ABC-type antimicrobial peptide transport system permease subunit